MFIFSLCNLLLSSFIFTFEHILQSYAHPMPYTNYLGISLRTSTFCKIILSYKIHGDLYKTFLFFSHQNWSCRFPNKQWSLYAYSYQPWHKYKIYPQFLHFSSVSRPPHASSDLSLLHTTHIQYPSLLSSIIYILCRKSKTERFWIIHLDA